MLLFITLYNKSIVYKTTATVGDTKADLRDYWIRTELSPADPRFRNTCLLDGAGLSIETPSAVVASVRRPASSTVHGHLWTVVHPNYNRDKQV